MARLNNTTLTGIVVDEPRVSRDPETGEYVHAMVPIRVIRSARNAQDGKMYAVFSDPVIYTREEAQIREIATWKLNDIVMVEGMFATALLNKPSFCEHCGEKNRTLGSFAYVQPIFMRVLHSYGSYDDALQELRLWRGHSNKFQGVGHLGRDPKRLVLQNKRGRKIVVCQYPMVLNRLYYVPSDPVEKTNDFPWVKSYGKHCDEDYFRLQSGSGVLIDGFLQTRHVRRHNVCQACGEAYDWRDSTMEIVPYEVEYLAKCRTQDEADLLQAKRREQSAKDIMAELKRQLGQEVNETGISEGEITDINDLET